MKHLSLAALLLLSCAPGALAAATPEGAAAIKTSLQTYFGATSGVVEVAPDGDAYRLTLDFAPLAAAAKDVKITTTPIIVKLTEQGGGKWQVDEDQPLSFVLDAGEKGTVRYEFGQMKMSGVFDEALGTFASQDATLSNMHMVQNFKDEMGNSNAVDYTIDTITSTLASVAAGSGADITVKQTYSGLKETVTIPPDPKLGTPAVTLTVASPQGAFDMTAKGAMTRPLNQLLAWFVAHPSKELMTTDQEGLRTAVRAALPLWNRMDMTGSLDKLTVSSPVGVFSADTMPMEIGMTGFVADASFREKFAVTGLKMPPGLVPLWAAGTEPKEASFGIAVSDIDLDRPARMFVDNMDLSKDKPVSDDISNQMLAALMPKGHATLTLEPSAIVSELYRLGYESTITMAPGKVQGNALITLKGLDEIMKLLSAAPPESGAQGAVGGLMMAKGMAKTEADGSLSWKIESSPDGGVLVNGVDMSKMMPPPAPPAPQQ